MGLYVTECTAFAAPSPRVWYSAVDAKVLFGKGCKKVQAHEKTFKTRTQYLRIHRQNRPGTPIESARSAGAALSGRRAASRTPAAAIDAQASAASSPGAASGHAAAQPPRAATLDGVRPDASPSASPQPRSGTSPPAPAASN